MTDMTAYGMPGVDGYIAQPPPMVQTPQSAYNVPDDMPDYPQQVPAAPPAAPSPFASDPFHQWLADNAVAQYKKNPYDLSDDDIKNATQGYLNGPVKNILARQVDQTHKSASNDTAQRVLDNELAYNKMLIDREVSQNLPAIKSYLAGLRPQTTAGGSGQSTSAPASSQGAVETGIRGLVANVPSLASYLSMAAAGLPRVADYLADPLGAAEGATPISNSQVGKSFQNAAFGFTDAADKMAKTIRGTPGQDTTSQIVSGLSRLPEGLATGNMSVAAEDARDALNKGVDLGTVERNYGIDAAANAALMYLPGGASVAGRALKGAGYGLAVNNAATLAKTGELPDAKANILNTVFGAALGGAFGPRAGGKPNPLETPPPKPGDIKFDTEANNPAFAANPLTGKAPDLTPMVLSGATTAPKAQALYDSLIQRVPVDQIPAFDRNFLFEVQNTHGVNPAKIKTRSDTTQPNTTVPTDETDLAAKATASEPVSESDTPSANTGAEPAAQSDGSTNLPSALADLHDSFERITDAPKNGETPRDIFGEISNGVPQEDLPALTEAFNNDWESAHGTRPIEEKPPVAEPAQAESEGGQGVTADAAPEGTAPATAVQPELSGGVDAPPVAPEAPAVAPEAPAVAPDAPANVLAGKPAYALQPPREGAPVNPLTGRPKPIVRALERAPEAPAVAPEAPANVLAGKRAPKARKAPAVAPEAPANVLASKSKKSVSSKPAAKATPASLKKDVAKLQKQLDKLKAKSGGNKPPKAKPR